MSERIRNGYGWITTNLEAVFSASIAAGTSIETRDVSEFNTHVFQLSIVALNGTSSAKISSSLDATNWQADAVLSGSGITSSLLTTISGRRSYIRASLTNSGNTTASLWMLNGQ